MINMSICSKNASPNIDEFIKLTQVTTITTAAQALENRLNRRRLLDSRKNKPSSDTARSNPFLDITNGCRVTHGIPLTRNQPSTILNPKGKENILTYSNVPSSYARSPSTDSSGQSKGKEKICINNDVQPTNRIQQNNGTTRFKNKVLSTSSGTSEIHDRPSTKRRLNPVGLDIPVFPTDLLNSDDGDEIKGISKGILI
ncbi:hypothetical protein QVD17_17370 [Tagetes erecta]|uniref:Uncharacterized protein n=1 Tax=Tagetes erecta TaxID=13708 RepID=A0AAD8NUA2_TARER|nr:hypothetical protein QVD17_17370 [Tagetes erecta]